MKTYLQNGTIINSDYIPPDDTSFIVYKMPHNSVDKYIYSGDHIKYEIDTELVRLYDTIRYLYFPNTDEYYFALNLLPMWVQEAGQNSDFVLSANQFSNLIDENKHNIPDLYKHLYVSDSQFLIGTVQNLYSAICECLCDYYIHITDIHSPTIPNQVDSIYTVTSVQSRYLSSIIETYFTKAYSILDIICKIAYEIENPRDIFTTHEKLKSDKILWGGRKHLTINKTPNTFFEYSDLIKKIESLRNEVVHNGTWELNPKVFIKVKNETIIERFMLFPDFDNGHLSSVKNRKHFFSSGEKINDILPVIHNEFSNLLLNTIKLLNFLGD